MRERDEKKLYWALRVIYQLHQMYHTEGPVDGPKYSELMTQLCYTVEELNNGPKHGRPTKGRRRDGRDDNLREGCEGSRQEALPGAGGPAGRDQLDLFTDSAPTSPKAAPKRGGAVNDV